MGTPAAPSDPHKRSATVAGGAFSYTAEGDGPHTLVAVHGLPGTARDFRWLAPALPPGIRLVRLELPGFGETPLATDPATHVDARAAFVLRALAALEVKRCVVLGHSMGGPVAVSAAVQGAGVVAGLALLSSVGLRPHHLLRRTVGRGMWARAVDVPVLGRGVGRLAHLAMRQAGFPASTTVGEAAQTLRIVGRLDFGALQRNVAALQVPTLAAHAQDDPFIEPPVQRELWGALPQGPRLWFDDGGHNIQKSRALELGAALDTFVASCLR